MNLIEAVKSGKRYREVGETEWICEYLGLEHNQTKLFTYNQFMAEYEIEEETYSMGDVFKAYNSYHILSRTEDECINLIDLVKGNMWADNVPVSDLVKITHDELEELVGFDDVSKFKKVPRSEVFK